MIRTFKYWLKSGKVKKGTPDIPQAKGLIKNGIEDLEVCVPENVIG